MSSEEEKQGATELGILPTLDYIHIVPDGEWSCFEASDEPPSHNVLLGGDIKVEVKDEVKDEPCSTPECNVILKEENKWEESDEDGTLSSDSVDESTNMSEIPHYHPNTVYPTAIIKSSDIRSQASTLDIASAQGVSTRAVSSKQIAFSVPSKQTVKQASVESHEPSILCRPPNTMVKGPTPRPPFHGSNTAPVKSPSAAQAVQSASQAIFPNRYNKSTPVSVQPVNPNPESSTVTLVESDGVMKIADMEESRNQCGLVHITGKTKQYMCNFCHVINNTAVTFGAHVGQHIFTCRHCKEKFFDLLQLVCHMGNTHLEHFKEIAGYVFLSKIFQKTKCTQEIPMTKVTPSVPSILKSKNASLIQGSSVPVIASALNTANSVVSQSTARGTVPTIGRGSKSCMAQASVSSNATVRTAIPSIFTGMLTKSHKSLIPISSTGTTKDHTISLLSHRGKEPTAIVSTTGTSTINTAGKITPFTKTVNSKGQVVLDLLLPSVQNPTELQHPTSYYTYKVVEEHGRQTRYDCDICAFQAFKQCLIIKHVQRHSLHELQNAYASSVIWQCHLCNYADQSQTRVVNHVISRHPRSKLMLKRYMYGTHTNTCSTESNIFVVKDDEETPVQAHQNIWGCAHCDFSTFERQLAVQHLKIKHPGKKLSITKRPVIQKLDVVPVRNQPVRPTKTKALWQFTQMEDENNVTSIAEEKLANADTISQPSATKKTKIDLTAFSNLGEDNPVKLEDLKNDRSLAASTDGLNDEKPAEHVVPLVDMEDDTAVKQTMSMLMGTYAEDFGPEGISKDLLPDDDKGGSHLYDNYTVKHLKTTFEVVVVADLTTNQNSYIIHDTTASTCSFCGAQFVGKDRKNHAKEHVTVHTGEKNYECLYCDWKNNRRNLTIEHNLRMHPGEPHKIIRHVQSPKNEAQELESNTYVEGAFSEEPEKKPPLLGPKSIKEAKILQSATTLWQCPYCERRSVFREILDSHMILVHPEKHALEAIQQWARPEEPNNDRNLQKKAEVCLVRVEDMDKYPVLKDILEEADSDVEQVDEAKQKRIHGKLCREICINKAPDTVPSTSKSAIKSRKKGIGVPKKKKREVRFWQGENESGWDVSGVKFCCKYCNADGFDGESAKYHLRDEHPNREPIAKDVVKMGQKQACNVRLCTIDDCDFATYYGEHYQYHLQNVHLTNPCIVPKDRVYQAKPKKISSGAMKRINSSALDSFQGRRDYSYPQRYLCGSPCGARFDCLEEVKHHMVSSNHSVVEGYGYMCTDLKSKMQKQRQVVFFCKNGVCEYFTKYLEELEAHVPTCPYDGCVYDPSMSNPQLRSGDISLEAVTSDDMYQCSYCTVIITSLDDIRLHVQAEHDVYRGGYSQIASTLTEDGNLLIQVKDTFYDEPQSGSYEASSKPSRRRKGKLKRKAAPIVIDSDDSSIETVISEHSEGSTQEGGQPNIKNNWDGVG